MPEGVVASISRCAGVLEDPTLLRDEVGQLREHPEQTAQFATALFDLERARRGDPDARTRLLEVADSLLVFWRERTGDALAATHPALGPLWAHASALLVSFEAKRFKRALDQCWEARGNVARLQRAVEGLLPAGDRRAEFAACLYHLELARLFDHSSRGEFARRASLVHEAYHSTQTANELIGDDAGLQHLWNELVPYLDEFFEALEAEQRRKLRSHLKTDPGGVVAAVGAPVPKELAETLDSAVAPSKPDTEVSDRPAAPTVRSPVSDSSGVFDLWLKDPNRPPAPSSSPALPSGPSPELDAAVDSVPSGRPPPPSNFTPAPGRLLVPNLLESGDLGLSRVSTPLDTTPVPAGRAVENESGILDLQDVVDEVPIDVDPPRRPSLDVEMGDYEPDQATQIFWRHTEEMLTLLPPADAPRIDGRVLSADGRADRKKLTGWLDGVTQRFGTVPEARAFACLMKLYLAAQLKEKGLFGGVNAKRKEAFVAALQLLSAEPLAAAHCAVWFELDGKETLDHLGSGLEVLTDYLQFCARHRLDPLDPQAPTQFMG